MPKDWLEKYKQILENIKKKVNEKGCWIWLYGEYTEGYGEIWISELNRSIGVHRLQAAIHHNLDLDNPKQLALHKCDTKLCFNPNCLYVGTYKDNAKDAKERGLTKNAHGGFYQMAKTHCPYGHEYTEENTFRRKNRNQRECRECQRRRNRERLPQWLR